MDNKLIQELAALGPPDIDRARAHAAVAIGEQVHTARRGQPQRTQRSHVAIAGVALAISVVLAAAALWTSPGQAVATWIGERFGAGEPGGPPALEAQRESWNRATVAEGQPAYVLAVGPAPASGRYEFIGYRPKAAAVRTPETDTPCFELNLPKERSSANQGCGIFPEGGVLFSNGFAGGFGRSGVETIYTAGRASMDVASVEIQFNGSPVEAELASIPVSLLGRIGVEKPFKFFIAFLPGGAEGGELLVTARDEGGQELDRSATVVPDLVSSGAGLPPPRPGQ